LEVMAWCSFDGGVHSWGSGRPGRPAGRAPTATAGVTACTGPGRSRSDPRQISVPPLSGSWQWWRTSCELSIRIQSPTASSSHSGSPLSRSSAPLG
jgi:hypothetical protein